MSRPPKPLIERKMPIPAAHSSLQHSQGGRLARRARHRLLLRDRPRDRGTARPLRAGRCTRAPAGSSRSTASTAAGAAAPARRHRRGVDAGRGRARSSRPRAPSACSSTTPATARAARSRASPLDDVRRQFETNVFGLVRLTQLVLPGMRAQGWGRIVNVSSMGGELTFPGGGCYHATKYAVEALSDALRFEVARLRDRRRRDPARADPDRLRARRPSARSTRSATARTAAFDAAVGAATAGAYDGGVRAPARRRARRPSRR